MLKLVEQGIYKVAGIAIGIVQVFIWLVVACPGTLGEFFIADIQSNN